MAYFTNDKGELFEFTPAQISDGIVPVGCTEITVAQKDAILVQRKQAMFDALPYDQKRLIEYPPIQDFLDAYVKDDIAGLQQYKTACLAVKAKYPKPV